jgi:hypothetical protein
MLKDMNSKGTIFMMNLTKIGHTVSITLMSKDEVRDNATRLVTVVVVLTEGKYAQCQLRFLDLGDEISNL